MLWKMEFITTSKGGIELIRNNFIYHLNKTPENGKGYWKCDKKRSESGCKAKTVLDQRNNFLRQSGEHTHELDPENVLVENSRSAIKPVAIETNTSAKNITAENIAGVTDNVLAKL